VLGAQGAPLLNVDGDGRVRFVLLADATGTLTCAGASVSAEEARLQHREHACCRPASASS
jgi:hypothetical protein